MFGKNPVRKQDLTHPDALRIKEIFYTLQGEGPYAGQVAVFVRLAGCNLQCYFCDTDFESDTHDASPEDILEVIKSMQPAGLVVLTGGEPMIQNIAPLCTLLDAHGYLVQIETAGTVWVPDLPDSVTLVCSPKTGGVHPLIAEHCMYWKYLIKAGEQAEHDGLPNGSTHEDGKAHALYRPQHGVIYLQPLDEQDELRNRFNMDAAVQTCMKFGYRLSLQQHKITGVR
jgi:7-carboxy-7-deazaguanine synthase